MTIGCEFCTIVATPHSTETVFEDEANIAFSPLQPATTGHLLVVPRQHRRFLWELTAHECSTLFTSVRALANSVMNAIRPDGLNIVQSNGPEASQTVFHVHVHIVPRWKDDKVGDMWPSRNAMKATPDYRALTSIRNESNRNT